VVDAAVGEIVSPVDDARPERPPERKARLEARAAWLRGAMAGHWSDLGPVHHAWRQRVLDRLATVTTDTVVCSHFIAINVAVGAALDDDRVVCFRPDNCSWTVLDVDGDSLRVVELGRQATTEVR
jgi:broad specificity phosphatase PhoE